MFKRQATRSAEPDIANIGALIGDPGRATMLLALLDGRDLAASDLSLRAGLSPQAATAHLKKLVSAGMLTARDAGRHRFFRLASAEIARAIETLAAIAPPARIVALDQSTALERMRLARSCYDHLAGRLGVGVTTRLIERGAIAQQGTDFALGRRANAIFSALGIDLDQARAQRRAFAPVCTDWTERRPHLAGSLGAAVLELFLHERWVTRNAKDRALHITPEGARALRTAFGLTW
ncbi:MAG TPA: winged helix-turn-helix domain-containing protein [Verrucomicrobiae bacterium]|nr:winged helix-turn-helix domain-containing protein [Verrucomicrobiae bacterium]